MKRLGRIGCVALLLALAAPAATWARVVKIETTTPLADHSDQAVEQALRDALDSCLQRATAMGLSWIRLDRAMVLTDKVVVLMVASDDAVEDDDVKVFEPTPPARPL